jgi:ERCC4-type nuclease
MKSAPFQDIFSKKKTPSPKKEKIPDVKIEIDYREKNCMVPTTLKCMGFEVELKELKVADYLVNGIAIERKTVSDFISSMINRRLFNQLDEMQQYENKLLIIEGINEQELYSDYSEGVSANAIRGFLLSIVLKHKIPLILTKDAEDTAKFISVLAKKKKKDAPINPKKKSLNKKEQKQFIIEGFPGIGPTTAKKILEEFKSIKNFVNATEEELEQTLGSKFNSVKKLIEDSY